MVIFKEFKGIFEVDKAFYECFKECVSTDETRYFLCAVYFDSPNNTFVATDGRRLLKHTPIEKYSNTKSGYYELAKIGKQYKMLPKDLEGTFPQWQKIVDCTEDYRLLTAPISDHTGRLTNKTTSFFNIKGNMREDSGLIGNIIIKNKCPINIDFVTKVLKYVGEFEIKYCDDDEVRPIYFIIDQCTTYMIQPMSR